MVPRSAIITPTDARQASSLASIPGAEDLPDWTLLALWLFELTHSDSNPVGAHAASSIAAAYALVLPAATGSVLEWEPEEVAWLRGSHLYHVANEIQAAAETSWQEVAPLAQHTEQAGLLPKGALTKEALTRAFSLVLSRAIRLEGVPGSPTPVDALVPWADLLNHESTSQAFLSYDALMDAVMLRCDRDYTVGEQVVCSYGQKTNGQLLLSYGFVPESNPHDGCLLPVSLDLIPRSSKEQIAWKAEALRRRGLECERVYPLLLQAVPQGLVAFAAFITTPVTDAAAAEGLASQIFDGPQGDEGLEPALELAGIEAVASLCKAKAAAYTPSV